MSRHVGLILLSVLSIGPTLLTIATGLVTVPSPFDENGFTPQMTHGYPIPWLVTWTVCTSGDYTLCERASKVDWAFFSIDVAFFLLIGWMTVLAYSLVKRKVPSGHVSDSQSPK